jgi:hypothetical protein
MAKPILFLLKPGFHDNGGPFYCTESAGVEGFLKYAPEVERRLDVWRIDFPRPRKEVVELLGAANQWCPILVLTETDTLPAEAKRSEETGRIFITGRIPICDYLGRTFGVVRPHP